MVVPDELVTEIVDGEVYRYCPLGDYIVLDEQLLGRNLFLCDLLSLT